MKFYEILFFILIDIIIHELVVRWEIRQNIELFKDIEVPRKWKRNL